MKLSTIPAFFAYNGLVICIYQGVFTLYSNSITDDVRFLNACVFTVICLGIVAGASMIESSMRR